MATTGQAGQRQVPVGVVAGIIVAIALITVTAFVLSSGGGSGSTAATGTDSSRSATEDHSTDPGPTSSDLGSTSSHTSSPQPVLASSSTTDSVDPDEAMRVSRELWAGVTAAIHVSDTGALRVYEAGPALEADIGLICEVGCPEPTFSTPLSINVNVPHQASWPAVFLATITYASDCHTAFSPCVDQLVVQQAAAGAAWQVVLRIQFGGSVHSEEPSLLPDRFAVAPPDLGTADTAALLLDYAGYYNAAKNTGQPPATTQLEDGPFTSDLPGQIYAPAAAYAQRGLSEPTTYSVNPADPMYAFATAGGTTSCGTIRFTTTLSRLDGGPLDETAALQEFALRIPDGSYSSITMDGLHMVCFERLTTKTLTTVVSTWGSQTSIAGHH